MNEQVTFFENKLTFEMDSLDLHEAIDIGMHVVVVDARSNDLYKQEHISSASNFPHRFINEDTTAFLDKNMLYISYCSGIGCNASTKGALKLSKLGFQVKELIGGWNGGKRKVMNPLV